MTKSLASLYQESSNNFIECITQDIALFFEPKVFGFLHFNILGLPFRNQKSEIRNQKSEIRNQKSEIRNQKSEIRNQKSEIRNQKSAISNQQSAISNQQSAISNQKSEVLYEKAIPHYFCFFNIPICIFWLG